MAKKSKSSKGAAFEREFSKQLSLWLSGGSNDDWCWRTAQSGGRATQRAKTGRTTAGAYGDLTATCPEAELFFSLFALELKNGYTNGSPVEVINSPPKKFPLDDFIKQAETAALDGQKPGAWLVWKQPRKSVMVFVPREFFIKLNVVESDITFIYKNYVCVTWSYLQTASNVLEALTKYEGECHAQAE